MPTMVENGSWQLRREIASAHASRQARLATPGLEPARAWFLIADTDLLNRALGNPEIEVCNIPVRPGLSRRVMTTRTEQPISYDEEHYQWERGGWVGGRRFFHEGPIEKFQFCFRVEPAAGGSVAVFEIGFWGRGVDGIAAAGAAATGLAGGLEQLAPRFLDAHRMAHPRLEPEPRHEGRLNRIELRVMAAALVDSGEDREVVGDLVKTIESAADHAVAHLAPLELATLWGRDAEQVIDVFIRATRLGMLEAEWSVACPNCRVAVSAQPDVTGLVRRRVHCDDCNIAFDADPTSNMALTFVPAPAVRRIEQTVACIGAPTRTPHVVAQSYVEPGATICVAGAESVRAGLRLMSPEHLTELPVAGPASFRLDDTGICEALAGAPGLSGIEVRNASDHRMRVRLVDTQMPSRFLRARQVLERPRFRELFGADQWQFLSAMECSWRTSFGFPARDPRGTAERSHFDLVVVGAGPGGEAAALRAAQLGRHAALVESSARFGGPSGLASKAMREAVRQILWWSQSSAEPHRPGEVSRRMGRVRALFEERFALLRRYAAALQMQDVARRLTQAGVSLHQGTARLRDGGVVEVHREGSIYELSAGAIVLATGSRPAHPPGIPFDSAHVLDATAMGGLERLPRSLLVAGAGVIGCEFATIMAALGVKVTVLASGHRPFPFLDEELAQAGLEQMRGAGIAMREGKLEDVRVQEERVYAQLADGSRLDADVMLYAEGREANTLGLGCEQAGVTLGRHGRIVVDADHRTTNPAIFAVGDLTGPPGLASTAAEQGKQVVETLFGGGPGDGAGAIYPTTVWTFPELAGVGMTGQDARARSILTVSGKAHYGDLPRGILSGDLHGWLKLIAEQRTGTLLGVHIVGEHACELIHYGRALVEARGVLEDVARSGFSAVTFHALYQAAAEQALFGTPPQSVAHARAS